MNWAVGPGAEAIRSVYARSGQLNGDAVVVFVRALCAVSQEELSPADPSEAPRAHSLARLIECGYHNLGRIRLIWRRLWAALSAHLVSAACHPDAAIARLAVDHMRALVSKLLARAELSNFTHQASCDGFWGKGRSCAGTSWHSAGFFSGVASTGAGFVVLSVLPRFHL